MKSKENITKQESLCRVSDRRRGTTRLSALLTFWTLLGLCGCGEVVYCGVTDDWIGFLIGLTYTLLAIFMLGSGLWKGCLIAERYPRLQFRYRS